jgi:hypothetical protein
LLVSYDTVSSHDSTFVATISYCVFTVFIELVFDGEWNISGAIKLITFLSLESKERQYETGFASLLNFSRSCDGLAVSLNW